ncbi:MAG TPA: protein-disulfide reductase DsbD [Burkholderiaceae bacterium]
MIRLPSMRAAWALLALLLTFAMAGPARAAGDFLDPDQAFTLSVRVLDASKLELDYKVAPGYYLYRERFKFASPDAKLGEPQIPPGKKHYDTALEQNVETYHDGVVVILPIVSAGKSFTLNATHQGCADKGLCYPPQPRTLAVTMKGFGADADSVKVVADADAAAAPAGVNPPAVGQVAGGMSVAPGALPDPLRSVTMAPGVAPAAQVDRAPQGGTTTILAPVPAAAPAPAPEATDSGVGAALAGGHLWLIILISIGAGLGLAATPCVWPMFPILSSIIAGQGNVVTPRRGLALAAMYSLGVALVYTALGVAAGLLGKGFAGDLQKPAVLATFGVLLVVLSLSMFGLYELQLPAALRDRLNAKNETLSGGQLGGVFAMGVLSALIVSPCVSAPLVGVLVYIGNQHDALLGGISLFSIAVGMCVPLLVIGASAGTLLPRSGSWMDVVKRFFGLMLLGVALYLVHPIVPALFSMLAWGALAIITGVVLGAFEPVTSKDYEGTARTVKGLGILFVIIGAIELVGASSGGLDPTQPLARLAGRGGASAEAGPRFDRVSSIAELDQRLQSAGRPVILDFYADWCVSCKEMESQTFVDPAVRAKLDKAVLLRADVTANSADDQALLKRFHLFGPPGIILFDAQGRELETVRVVGFQDAAQFSASLSAAGL